MSEKCPECGAESVTPLIDFSCGTKFEESDMGHYLVQSDRCKINQLTAELAALREQLAASIPVSEVKRVADELMAWANEWSLPNPPQARGLRKAAERVRSLIPDGDLHK